MEVPMLVIKITLASWIVLPLISYIFFKWGKKMHSKAMEEQAKTKSQKSRNQSLSTRYGQITEQFLPLVNDYPYDPKNFRFLGSPIDGVQFEEDRVILVEFKAASSRMSKKQRRIKDLVKKRKVDFELLQVS